MNPYHQTICLSKAHVSSNQEAFPAVFGKQRHEMTGLSPGPSRQKAPLHEKVSLPETLEGFKM